MQDRLTSREREVLALIAEGRSSKEIAYQLRMSFKTACCHRWRILRKFNAHNTAEMIRKAVTDGLLNLTPSNGHADGQPAANGLPVRLETTMEPLLLRLDVLLQENRRYFESLRSALARSKTVCRQAENYREQLREEVQGTKVLCAEFKAGGDPQAAA